MERRELLGVSAFLISSGALIGITQLPDNDSAEAESACNPEIDHSSSREVLAGQQWSREFVVSELNPVFSLRAITSNDQTIRLEIENSDGTIVEEQSGNSIEYTESFNTFGVGEVRIYNTGEATQTAVEDLWSDEVEELSPNAELSLWIEVEANQEVVYDISTVGESVEGTLDVQIENGEEEIIKEDVIETEGTGSFVPEDDGRHYLRFTNTTDQEIEWTFTFERNISVGKPTDLAVEMVKGQESCSVDAISSTFSEITTDL